MKLIKLDQTTLPKQFGGGNKTPKVSFGKSGTVSFNAPACKLMEFEPLTKITLAQDEEARDNWYFFKDDVNGFGLRQGYDKKGCMFNHSKMVGELVGAFGMNKDITHNFLIAGKPTMIKGDKTKYWGLIMRPSV